MSIKHHFNDSSCITFSPGYNYQQTLASSTQQALPYLTLLLPHPQPLSQTTRHWNIETSFFPRVILDYSLVLQVGCPSVTFLFIRLPGTLTFSVHVLLLQFAIWTTKDTGQWSNLFKTPQQAQPSGTNPTSAPERNITVLTWHCCQANYPCFSVTPADPVWEPQDHQYAACRSEGSSLGASWGNCKAVVPTGVLGRAVLETPTSDQSMFWARGRSHKTNSRRNDRFQTAALRSRIKAFPKMVSRYAAKKARKIWVKHRICADTRVCQEPGSIALCSNTAVCFRY